MVPRLARSRSGARSAPEGRAVPTSSAYLAPTSAESSARLNRSWRPSRFAFTRPRRTCW
jgi:hypothetical protein